MKKKKVNSRLSAGKGPDGQNFPLIWRFLKPLSGFEKRLLFLFILLVAVVIAKASFEIRASEVSAGETLLTEPDKTPYGAWILDPDMENRQKNNFECGPAALSVALKLMGKPISVREIAVKTGTGSEGTSMLGMYRFLKGLGFEAYGFRNLTVKDLRKLKHPSIAHVGGEHYVTIMNQQEEFLYIFDPLWGKVLIAERDFAEIWDGTILSAEQKAGNH